MESGIYIIINSVDGKVYVGSAKNFKKRWNRHLKDLKKGTHSSTKLQRAYNKYSVSDFLFKIVERTEYKKPDIVEKENFYIKHFNAKKNGYNIADASFGDTLTNHPNREDIIARIKKTLLKINSNMSKEDRAKKYGHLLEANPNWKGGSSKRPCDCGNKKSRSYDRCLNCRDKSRIGSGNGFFGKSHTKKTKDVLSNKNKGGKPTNIRPIEINGVKYESAYEASLKLKISHTTIRWRVRSKNKRFEKYIYI